MNLTRPTPENLHPKDNHNIIDNLPAELKQACCSFDDAIEQFVFFYSAVGVLSGCLPNYIGNYDGKWISPHLYIFILASYGTGKGTMTFARHLGMSIHKKKRDRYKQALANYLAALKSNGKKGKADKDSVENAANPEPASEMLYMPADTSKSALVDALNDNNGCGIVFETEGDTLKAALGQDYGTFMDILLKAFHHELISFMRRQNKENKEISEPRLAVILSSTYDQFLDFIRSAENGLVSRFAYYLLPENKTFRNVFANDKQLLQKYFEEFGRRVEDKYNHLYALPEPITFHFTDQQQETFNSYFGKVKQEAAGLEGSINRLALITYRIAMILSFFRHYEYHKDQHPDKYFTCADRDFTNALAISQVLQENAESIHDLLPKIRGKKPGNIDELYDALPDEFTAKEAKAKAAELKVTKRTAERFLEKDVRLDRTAHGRYKKIK